MRLQRIIFGYLLREMLLYGLLAFFVIATLLVSQNVLRRLDALLTIGVSGDEFLTVLALIMPTIATIAVPIAFLLGAVLASRRVATDGEATALRACGAGPMTFLAPALCLGLAVSVLCGWLLLDVEYKARRELVQLFRTVAARGGIIEPGKFRAIGNRVIFVEDRDRDRNLSGIMIFDHTRPERPFRVFARSGVLRFDEDARALELRLQDGELHIQPTPTVSAGGIHVEPAGLADGEGGTALAADPDELYQRIRFDTFSYAFDVSHILGMSYGPVRPKQMSIPEMREVIQRATSGDALRELDQRDAIEYTLEIDRRLATPIAPLLFAAVAVPLGLAGGTSMRGGRSWGVFLCVVVVFAYYALLTFSQFLVREQALPSAAAFWGPNALFAALAAGIFWREQRRIPR